MTSVLRYGADSSVELEMSDEALLAECGNPRGQPVDDPIEVTAAALAEPLDFPPLARAIVPGDHVLLALEHGVPQAAGIVAAAVRTLVDEGIEPADIVVLRSPADVEAGGEDPRRMVPRQYRGRIALLTHEPHNRERLAYLTATAAGEPILLNRALVDADLVLPIGCFHGGPVGGYRGIHGSLYPTFSDQRTLQRFRAPGSLQTDGRHDQRLVDEVNEVGWLLGIVITIQVVPGPGDRILHVLAGDVNAVDRRAGQLYEAAWHWSVPGRADLVVAAIEGSAVQQTWHNLGRALAAAAPVVADGGAIAVCCELATQPGPALQRLAAARSREAELRRINKDRPVDTLCATELANALRRGRVYLLSRLDESLIEQLDIAPVAGADELARLARRCESCIILSNAPRAMVTLQE